MELQTHSFQAADSLLTRRRNPLNGQIAISISSTIKWGLNLTASRTTSTKFVWAFPFTFRYIVFSTSNCTLILTIFINCQPTFIINQKLIVQTEILSSLMYCYPNLFNTENKISKLTLRKNLFVNNFPKIFICKMISEHLTGSHKTINI